VKSILIALLLVSPFASARVVNLSCVLPSLDVNGQPAQVLGVRFYAA
jgi:hypothetical protein